MLVPRGPLRRAAVRLGRWPRRIAAVSCLLLAAGSALTPPARTARVAPRGPAAGLRTGEVALPVPVTATEAGLVTRGDRVGLLAASDPARRATLVADRLRVLSVRAADATLSDTTAVVVVATDRAAALSVARFSGTRLTLIVDDLP
jgi:hypothetical protein